MNEPQQEPLKLLPCPFCGNPHPSKVVGRSYCECQHCDTKGPRITDSAIKDWNTRAPAITPADAPTHRTDTELISDGQRMRQQAAQTVQDMRDAPTDATAQIAAVLDEAKADGEGTPTTIFGPISIPLADATGEAGGPPEGWQAYAEKLARKLGEMTRDRDEQASAASYNLSMQEAANREAEAARNTIATLRDECARLREDKARLDKVEAEKWTVTWNPRHMGFIVQQTNQVCGNIGHAPTLRSAIDDASSGTEERE